LIVIKIINDLFSCTILYDIKGYEIIKLILDYDNKNNTTLIIGIVNYVWFYIHFYIVFMKIIKMIFDYAYKKNFDFQFRKKIIKRILLYLKIIIHY